MELTKYGDIGNATAGWYETMLLSYAKPDLIAEPFGLVKRIPRNKTRVVQYRRPQTMKPATMPLREGVTPSGSPFGYDTVSAQLNQYGDYVPLTDVVDETSIDDVYMDCAEQQGHQIALTREVLITDVICSGTSAIFGDGTTALRSGINKDGIMVAQRLRNQIAYLKKQKAMKFTEVIMPSEDYETFGIEPSFIALTHTDLEPNIRDIQAGSSKFIPTVRYGNYSISSPFEIGNFENTRFICGADWPIYEGRGCHRGRRRRERLPEHGGLRNQQVRRLPRHAVGKGSLRVRSSRQYRPGFGFSENPQAPPAWRRPPGTEGKCRLDHVVLLRDSQRAVDAAHGVHPKARVIRVIGKVNKS